MKVYNTVKKESLKISLIITIIYVLISLPILVEAGSFRAVPIRIYLDSHKKIAILKVINDGEEKVTVQLEAMSWRQNADGKDIYEPTSDIIFFPKIGNIAVGEEKIIRVGYQFKKTVTNEKAYRLYIQELPISEPGKIAVKMAIRMGLPVFITPEKVVKKGFIKDINLLKGSLMVNVQNQGNSHILLNQLKVNGFNGTGVEVFTLNSHGWYVLPGNTKGFSIDVPKEDCLKAKEVKVEIGIKNSVIKGHYNIDSSLCTEKPISKEQRVGKAGDQMNSSD